MGIAIKVGYFALLRAIRSLYEQKQITAEQFACCLRRAKEKMGGAEWSNRKI